MRRYFWVLVCLFTCVFLVQAFAQQTLVLRPDAENGKDGYINSIKPDKNYQFQTIVAAAWTIKGVPTIVRGLVEFDLSQIPENATVLRATLSLYAFNSPADGNHSTSGGSNEALLQRITSDWDKSTLTWNNQPVTTFENQVELIESVSSLEDYLNINVTQLVQDMVANPSCSFGFILRLVTEVHYRRMLFASSDNHNPNLHPKLEIEYTLN